MRTGTPFDAGVFDAWSWYQSGTSAFITVVVAADATGGQRERRHGRARHLATRVVAGIADQCDDVTRCVACARHVGRVDQHDVARAVDPPQPVVATVDGR